MSSRVSICIPTYLHADLFERCLQSIVVQNFENIEVIVSDDSPNDSIKMVVEKFKAKLNLQYWQNRPSLGSPANWNHALDKASGELLMLLHQDDWLAKSNSLSHYVHEFDNNPDTSVVFGRHIVIDRIAEQLGKEITSEYFKLYLEKPVLLFLRNVIGPPSNVMLRRSISVRYNSNYKWLVDIEFYIHLRTLGYKFSYVNEHLVMVGLHEGQMTNFVSKNTDILVRENVLFAYEYLSLLKDDLNVYDHFWRLLRNHNVRSKSDLIQMGIGEEKLTSFILQMVKAQSKIPTPILMIGLFSKMYMFLSYLSR